MKKVIFICILMLMISILLAGCGNEENVSEKEITATYEKLNVDLELSEGENLTYCYCTDEQMVFSIGERTGAQAGPLVNTKYLILYNYKEGNIEKKFDINSDAYVYNAVPYLDGILFSTYENSSESDTLWEVQYISDNETVTIDRGNCESYEKMPAIAYLGENPIYVYEDIEEEYQCGVKMVENMNATSLIKESRFRLLDAEIHSNGSQYAFMADKTQDYSTYIIGDKDGIIREYELKDKLLNYSINKDFAICSLQNSDTDIKLLAINLKDGSDVYADAGRALYRMKGSGDTCLTVDSGFTMFAVNTGKTISKTQIELPEELENKKPSVMYYPLSEGRYAVKFDEDLFYIMKISYKS